MEKNIQKQRNQFFQIAIALMQENKHALVFEETGKLLLENSGDAELWNLLGAAAKEAHGNNDAILAFRKAVELAPGYVEAWRNLGAIYSLQHALPQALEAYRTALALRPDPVVHSNILFLQQKFDKDPASLFEAHRHYGQVYGGKNALSFRNSCKAGRKLRIGYVSGDLRQHSVAFFIEPILAHHDHDSFEIHAFSNSPEDEVSLRLQNYVDHWHNIFALSDSEACALIRKLKIDVLVDLSGHTNLNRLPVFGMRAAPVQVTWFGYMATTGLAEMDYRLTDGYMNTPETQRYYTEALYPLKSAVVWQPARAAPDVVPPPCLQKGHITFGSFNHFAKINLDVWETWARLMAAVPEAVLVILAEGASEDSRQQFVQRIFSTVNAQDRLVFVERQPLETFLRLFEHIDIALDPFPYNGGTTSLHSLWAGVPIVTLSGNSEIERAGEGILSNVGLDKELTARTPDEYIDIAARLAGEPQKLAEWRSTMREKLRKSSIMDYRSQTQEVENAFRDMFQRYCRQCENVRQ